MPYPSTLPFGLLGMLPPVGGAGTIPGPGNRMQQTGSFEDPIYNPGLDPRSLIGLLGSGGGAGGGGVGGLDWSMGDLDLVTRNGVQLQPEAMQSLMQLRKRFDIPTLSMIGTSYRDAETQRRLYEQWKSGQRNIQAAPPGKSYHNYGLAFDLNQRLTPQAAAWLNANGWQNTVPGEWWHWSYGDAPWGGS